MKRLHSRIISLLLAIILISLVSVPVLAGPERTALEVVRVESEMDSDGGKSVWVPVETRNENKFDLSWMIKDHPCWDNAYTKSESIKHNGNPNDPTKNHVVLSEAAQQIRFFGYDSYPFMDMCYNDDLILGLTSVEFTLETLLEGTRSFHVLSETGFLFNGKLINDTYTGYALILKVPKNSDSATNKAHLALYYLKNEVMRYDSVPYPKDLPTPLFIFDEKIYPTENHKYDVKVTRDPQNGGFTIEVDKDGHPLDEYTEKSPENSNPEFGFYTGYFSHGCNLLTRIYYENVKIEVADNKQGSVVIDKWVDGEFILDWVKKQKYAIDYYARLMQFSLYKVDYYGASFANQIPISGPTQLGLDGKIHFDNCITQPGWYAINETLSRIGLTIFEQMPPLYIYIDDSLNYDGTIGNLNYYGDPLIIVSQAGDSKITMPNGGKVCNVMNKSGSLPLPVVDLWKTNMVGYKDSSRTFNDFFCKYAKFIWDTEDTFQYGVSGSTIIANIELNITEQQINNGVTLNFACDNAAIIDIIRDDQFARVKPIAWTQASFENRPIKITDLSYNNFDGTAWQKIESVKLDSRYLRPGRNIIQISAANSAKTYYTGTPNDEYNNENNPCGLVFQIEASGVVFENRTKPPSDYVCEVEMGGNTDRFFSLDDALATIGKGNTATVRLLKNIDYMKNEIYPAAALTINGRRDITFDMNGYNLNVVNTGSGYGLSVLDGSIVRMFEESSGEFNITGGYSGVSVVGKGSEATVTSSTGTGKCDSVSAYSAKSFVCGIYVDSYACATVIKDVMLKRDDSLTQLVGYGAYAGIGSKLTVVGNVIGDDYGAVYAEGGTIYIKGNAKAGNVRRGYGAAMADNKDGLADCDSVIGGAIGSVTIDGFLTRISGIYVRVGGLFKNEGDYTITSTKPGYYTYDISGLKNTPSVWVKTPWSTQDSAFREE